MEVRPRIFTLALILCWCWAAPCPAQSFKYGPVQTIEWLAADADVVVHATILDVILRQDSYWTRARARSIEAIKGEVPKEFEFAVHGETKLLSRYRGREVLLFLRAKERHSSQQDDPSPSTRVLPHLTFGWAVIGLDENPNDFAVTMDFAVLTRPGPILEAARSGVKHSSGRPRPKSYQVITVPSGTEIGERVNGFNGPSMTLPLDDRLEPKALEWVRSPNPDIRLEGVVALRRFRSEGNIAVLKALLSDPYCSGGRYHVRTGAFNVLTGWGIECGRPVLDLPRPPDRRP